MALDTNELRSHVNRIADRYVGILQAVDQSITKSQNAVGAGTAFHTQIGADGELDPVEVAEMQARLVGEKRRIADAMVTILGAQTLQDAIDALP